ncbi:HAMP domain-containing histidine kinase [Rhodoblastus acidophilus]|uniref:histidine kinase n=1 Tax=Candidatus Rhodoblastus alkanivorans TaxID=2954117 RepID=A0ABS9ZAX8_9HYPH|nr:HAMP domain-containing sensor histidine kinase [Candidatus Rhodoblastus alkanivorans]MCI4679393.1 HAMP domain-containing histidine kinase [Candidatus Rhodoblastus alkanivorans]MCI4684869.1 HAMP domain-containing histidine kinase [Candidatus Rhodoblastus alkanivorans]MDI4642193.1 HAMP domain-containing histidine kinase [Rhodoblastus acidophilus]
MSPRDLIRSTPLRLAAAFALAIVLLTGGVFVFVFEAATASRISQLRAVFVDEARKAAASDDARLRRALSLRLTRDFRRLNYVALYDSSGRLLFGNLDRKPDIPADGRSHYLPDFRLTAESEPEPTLMVARARLDGDVIVLGRSIAEVDLLRSILGRALSFAILPVAAGALAMGFFFARRTAARIKDIDGAIAEVVNGDLRARLPSRSGLDELDGVIASVNHMLDEIERLMSQLATVGDNIAHDLRTPLVNVRAILDRALAEAPRGSSLRPPIQSALRQLDRAMTAIAALLRVSAIEREHRHSAFAEIDLAGVCAELREFFLPLAEAKGVSLRLDAARPVIRKGDPDLMREAVANLIDNALKFTPRGGAVRVSATEEAGLAQIEVSDNGRGVPAAEVHDIFRRFARATNGADLPGSGLGLSIVETIARLHGMDLVLADNAPGARFKLTERSATGPGKA